MVSYQNQSLVAQNPKLQIPQRRDWAGDGGALPRLFLELQIYKRRTQLLPTLPINTFESEILKIFTRRYFPNINNCSTILCTASHLLVRNMGAEPEGSAVHKPRRRRLRSSRVAAEQASSNLPLLEPHGAEKVASRRIQPRTA